MRPRCARDLHRPRPASPSGTRLMTLGMTMRVPTGPLFKPFDYALMVGFAMAFIMLTTLRLA